ncbi:unnamed protein product [Allacma fusca]|uniref:Dual specificity protein phosphatase 15 n=1 Tax=Allacma fusca TaxID=39272 RepID=A0A8J2LC19_9HEXA|nr:unnamed protein product [Allacma fusca]
MNRVLPGLYVGNYRDSKDTCQLERHKISHIIAIHDAARRIHSDKEYLCIMASDSPYQNLSQYFPTCNDFIHSARVQGSQSNVLIHCLAGMSRSVTIVIAYIMSITSLRWNEALKVVRGARAVSNPNSGFQKQLQEFESTRLAEERRRLAEKFPGTIYSESDEEHCKRLLASYNNLLLSRAICEGRCSSARVCPTGTCRAHYGSPKLGRQKSTESSIQVYPAIASSSSSKPESGMSPTSSTTASPSPSPHNSPKGWERHYGCWKNHFRQRQSSAGSGSGSAPGSPVLYRVSKGQRSDSMTSISSSSSVNSLPTQLPDRDCFVPNVITRSCPNSPRRLPKKLPRTGSQAENDSSLMQHQASGSSKSSPNVWQPPASTCSRFQSHTASARNAAPKPSGISSNTRWVMKRSAYRYNMEND